MDMTDIVTHVYRSRDFEFVVAAMCLEDPKLKVVELTSFAVEKNDRAGRHRRVTFDLVGVDDDDSSATFDVRERMEELELEYFNGELRVDPLKIFSRQRSLRAMITDAPPKESPTTSAEEVAVEEGSTLSVMLVREGKRLDQAVGYLADDTLVVVERGKLKIGEEVQIYVTGVLQLDLTHRRVFGRIEEDEI